jgi:ferredoxin, 2Fe-2S
MKTYKIKVTDLEGKTHEVEGLEGYRLMEVIRDNDIHIKAECNGCCACAGCHVYVGKKWLSKIPVIQEEEKKLLSDSYSAQDNSRLSCQILLTEEIDGIEVILTPDCE